MKTRFPTRFSLSPRIPAFRLGMITMVSLLACCGSAATSWAGQPQQVHTPPMNPWQTNQVIQPAGLAKQLSAATGTKPLVLCVGFKVLYQGGHITGAQFAGPASKPAGLEALKHAVQDLPHGKHIVLYCGCCPWNRCPNIRPAFRTMQKLGFTNVQVLSVPTNLREDWITKGFPTEKGSSRR